MKYPRYLKTKVLKSASASPAIFLTGGRQTGKTTLMKEIAKEHSFDYITFDDIRVLSSIRSDPIGVLQQYLNKPLIIDEMQRVPEIALPMKFTIDNNRKNGMYLLTGSSNPLVVPKLNDSLAGRLFILQLWPLSYAEILQIERPMFLENLFLKKWPNSNFRRWSKEEMISIILKGGYPTVQDIANDIKEEWFNNHLRTLLERDIQDLAQIKKLDELPLLMQTIANRSGSLLNISELSRTTKIPYTTLNFYLTLLEALYLIIRQPSWHKNHTRRITKSTKIYVTDTGLASFLIGANEKRLLAMPTLLGALVETFVVMEIEKLMSFSSMYLSSYHYRSTTGQEVDIVIENKADLKKTDTQNLKISCEDTEGIEQLTTEIITVLKNQS